MKTIKKMFNFDYIRKEDKKILSKMDTNSRPFISNINNWRLWIQKKNAILNPIDNELDIDKIYLYAKDPYKAKYQLLTNKRESTGLKYFNDSKAFTDFSNDMDDIDKNIEQYNPNKKRKILIVFDDNC